MSVWIVPSGSSQARCSPRATSRSMVPQASDWSQTWVARSGCGALAGDDRVHRVDQRGQTWPLVGMDAVTDLQSGAPTCNARHAYSRTDDSGRGTATHTWA
jgi:hypothetical protein